AAIPAATRPRTHLRIGRALLNAGADLGVAVAQLDRGRAAIEQADERLELARLNLLAAERARRAAAFDALSEYCRTGLELLGPGAWETDRRVAFELTCERADAEMFAGNLEEASRLLSAAVTHTATRLEQTRCARLMVQ